MARILVVDDERTVGALIEALLAAEGHEVGKAVSGHKGLDAVDQGNLDLVILDIGLPDLDGWQVLEEIRRSSDVPVLMLTGRGSEADKVRGLRGGADDYLAKPFGRGELVARVEALLRRSGATRPRTFDDGFTAIDFDRRTLVVRGHQVSLTKGEADLLSALLRNPGVVVPPSKLLADGWDEKSSDADRAKTAIHRLRKKLAAAGVPGYPIEAVRGVGYRYAATTYSADSRPCQPIL